MLRLLLPMVLVLVLGCAGSAALHPNAVEHNRAGAEALAVGDLEAAHANFALALEYHPRFVEALTNLGLVEMQRGNFERARTLFERACRYNKDLAQPHHALGVLAERERRPDLAAEHYRQALRVHPGFGPSRANLGRVLFSAGFFDEAREQFARLLASDDLAPQGYIGLAETLIKLDRAHEAQEVVERARSRFGDLPELVLLLARQDLRAGAHDEAEAKLLPLTESRDDNARAAWSFLAVSRLMRGTTEAALEAAEQALRLDRHDAVATYVVGVALRDQGDPRALDWLERARVLAPKGEVLAEELEQARATLNARR